MTPAFLLPLALAYVGPVTLAPTRHGVRRAADVRLADTSADSIIDDSKWTLSETGLRFKDAEVGTGEPMNDGDTVSIHYKGMLPTGEQFDNSRAPSKSGNPLKFEIGAGMIIPGWNEGVKSMRLNGKRTLSIPPELGFGPNGSPDGKVKPNAKIFIECELVDVERGGFKIPGLELPKYDPKAIAVLAVLAIPYLLPPGTLPDEIAFIWGK